MVAERCVLRPGQQAHVHRNALVDGHAAVAEGLGHGQRLLAGMAEQDRDVGAPLDGDERREMPQARQRDEGGAPGRLGGQELPRVAAAGLLPGPGDQHMAAGLDPFHGAAQVGDVLLIAVPVGGQHGGARAQQSQQADREGGRRARTGKAQVGAGDQQQGGQNPEADRHEVGAEERVGDEEEPDDEHHDRQHHRTRHPQPLRRRRHRHAADDQQQGRRVQQRVVVQHRRQHVVQAIAPVPKLGQLLQAPVDLLQNQQGRLVARADRRRVGIDQLPGDRAREQQDGHRQQPGEAKGIAPHRRDGERHPARADILGRLHPEQAQRVGQQHDGVGEIQEQREARPDGKLPAPALLPDPQRHADEHQRNAEREAHESADQRGVVDEQRAAQRPQAPAAEQGPVQQDHAEQGQRHGQRHIDAPGDVERQQAGQRQEHRLHQQVRHRLRGRRVMFRQEGIGAEIEQHLHPRQMVGVVEQRRHLHQRQRQKQQQQRDGQGKGHAERNGVEGGRPGAPPRPRQDVLLPRRLRQSGVLHPLILAPCATRHGKQIPGDIGQQAMALQLRLRH